MTGTCEGVDWNKLHWLILFYKFYLPHNLLVYIRYNMHKVVKTRPCPHSNLEIEMDLRHIFITFFPFCLQKYCQPSLVYCWSISLWHSSCMRLFRELSIWTMK